MNLCTMFECYSNVVLAHVCVLCCLQVNQAIAVLLASYWMSVDLTAPVSCFNIIGLLYVR